MATPTFDPIPDAGHAPDLYASARTAEPIPALDEWGEGETARYREDGFVPVARGISEADVNAARRDLLDLVALAPDDVELQFEHAATGTELPENPLARADLVRKLMRFRHRAPALDAIASAPELLAVVARLLGAEPEPFQDMALLKPPGIGREKPWHQDHAYFDVPAGTPVVGVWIALHDATPENGCMVFLPGGHRQGARPHFDRRDWQICDDHVAGPEARVAAPLPAGGLLVFDGLTPHGTASNRSATRRWAVQFHYVPRGTPRLPGVRREIFGETTFGASC